MQIDERAVGDGMVVDLMGHVTEYPPGPGTEQLRHRINSLVKRGHTRILLNFADVLSVDSAGLGDLVASYMTVSRAGGSLKLLNLTKHLKALLSFAKLDYLEGSEGDEQAYIGSRLKPRGPSDVQAISLPLPTSDLESD